MSALRVFTRFLLGAVCAVALTTGANAADAAVEEAVVLEPGFTWTGLYIGANAGYSWGDFDHHLAGNIVVGGGGPYSEQLDADADGVTGGVQIGYNWQVGSFVLGVEVDAQATGVDGSITEHLNLPPGQAFLEIDADLSTELDWFGTARLRAGFAPSERLLIYGTGGFAFGETTTKGTFVATSIAAGGNIDDKLSEKNSRTGWAAGAGGEYAFADNWTMKAEYLYTDLGEENILSADNGPFSTSLNSDVKFHTVRLGVNYKF